LNTPATRSCCRRRRAAIVRHGRHHRIAALGERRRCRRPRRLFKALYPDLRRIARKRLSIDERGTLLDTTALVHECY
jgi:hypothetical protein